mgnify:CR=1 FL=1
MHRRPPPALPADRPAPTALAAAVRRRGATRAAVLALPLIAAAAAAEAQTLGTSGAGAADPTRRSAATTTVRRIPTRAEAAPRTATLPLRGSVDTASPLADDPLARSPAFDTQRPGERLVDPEPLTLEPIGRPATARATPPAPTPAARPTGSDPALRIDPATGRPLPSATPAVRGPVEPVTRTGTIRGAGPILAEPAVQPRPRDALAAKREEATIEEDDYAPLGLRTGGFTWLPAIESSTGWNSNVASKVDGASGMTYRVAPELRGKSDWSRHSLEVELRGAYLGNTVDHDYDKPSFQGMVRGRIDLGDETRLDLKTSYARDRQSPTSVDDPTLTAVPATLATATGSVGLTRDVGLLAVTLRGDVERADYSGGLTTTGASLGSEVQNNTRWVGALRAAYGSPGTLRPFAEVQVSTRAYDEPLVAGSPRDATGGAVKAGVLADLGPTLRGELSTGWGVERPNEGPLPEISGWLLDGALVWSPTRLTSVRIDAKTSFDPTTLAASTGAVTRTVGVAVDQALRRDLVASAGVALSDKRYVGVDLHEDDLVLSTGLTYKVNRNVQTFVKGSLERFTSSTPGSDYDAAAVMVGVRLQR